jgi:hypothetical protein
MIMDNQQMMALAERVEQAGPLRGADGRFLLRYCPDPNCGGTIVADSRESWMGGPRKPIARCDGLTHLTDDGPLIACPVTFDRALTPDPHNG